MERRSPDRKRTHPVCEKTEIEIIEWLQAVGKTENRRAGGTGTQASKLFKIFLAMV